MEERPFRVASSALEPGLQAQYSDSGQRLKPARFKRIRGAKAPLFHALISTLAFLESD